MIDNDVRDVIQDVLPPIPTEVMRAEPSGIKTISAACPFFREALTNEAIRQGEGGEQFLTGLVEAFYRIFMALQANKLDSILHGLTIDDLWAADQAIKDSTAMLEANYPALVGRNIESFEHFGAGVYVAHALVDLVLSKGEETEVEEEPEPKAKPKAKKAPHAPDILSLLDEEPAPAPQPKAAPKPAPRDNTGNARDNALDGAAFPVAIVYDSGSDRWLVSCSVPMMFQNIAELGRMIKEVFGPEALAATKMTASEGNQAQVSFLVGGKNA